MRKVKKEAIKRRRYVAATKKRNARKRTPKEVLDAKKGWIYLK